MYGLKFLFEEQSVFLSLAKTPLCPADVEALFPLLLDEWRVMQFFHRLHETEGLLAMVDRWLALKPTDVPTVLTRLYWWSFMLHPRDMKFRSLLEERCDLPTNFNIPHPRSEVTRCTLLTLPAKKTVNSLQCLACRVVGVVKRGGRLFRDPYCMPFSVQFCDLSVKDVVPRTIEDHILAHAKMSELTRFLTNHCFYPRDYVILPDWYLHHGVFSMYIQ